MSKSYIPTVPLTPAAFAPFGTVLQNPSHTPPSGSNVPNALTVNQATALKYQPLPSFAHTYPPSSPAPSLTTNIFVCKPRALLPADAAAGLPERYACSLLEKHPHTPQSFIPLGLTPTAASSRYIVIVAPDLNGEPDWKELKAFLCHGSQGVTYGAGTWHSPMVVVGKKEVDFVVMVWENKVEGMDTVEVRKEGEAVKVEVPGGIGSGEGGLWGKSKL